jgi:hypothetical protein
VEYEEKQQIWLMIMENVPQNEKLPLFIDFFKQWMENRNVSIDVWNINMHLHWTNNAVKGCNFKLKGFVGEQHRNVFLQVRKLKEEAEFVSWQLKGKKLGEPGKNESMIMSKKTTELNIMQSRTA